MNNDDEVYDDFDLSRLPPQKIEEGYFIERNIIRFCWRVRHRITEYKNGKTIIISNKIIADKLNRREAEIYANLMQ